MKIFTFLIVALLVSLNNYCQVMYSNNGYLGGNRVLLVYAQVDPIFNKLSSYTTL